jgi:hypothetical protein
LTGTNALAYLTIALTTKKILLKQRHLIATVAAELEGFAAWTRLLLPVNKVWKE